MPTGLYIHIPFCKKKCSYCDFVSYAGKEDLIDDYVDALCRKITALTPIPSPIGRGGTPMKSGWVREINTIYFGGGTPTLLTPSHFKKILSNIDYRLSIIETTVEANPGTVNKEYLRELKELGVNRLSIGAQSFNDKHLKTLGRIHDSKQIYQAVEDAKSAGFENINLDLIFAIPNQTVDEWEDDLKKAVALDPTHLSTYNLQIEEGTPLWTSIYGELRSSFSGGPINEDIDADMYEYTIEQLTTNGFKHYEISNFAKPGFECKHNLNYWLNGNYIGIGAGAHSHVNGNRQSNTDNIEEYINTIKGDDTRIVACNSSSDGRPKTENRITHDETGSATDNRETIFMGLRLTGGLPSEKFIGFEDQVKSLIKDDLLEKRNGNVKLTKKGLMLGNLVFEKFV